MTHELLRILDAVVRADLASPGFTGDLCVGVQDASGTSWWWFQVGTSVVTSFSSEMPENTDALLILGEKEASSLIETGEPPTSPEVLFLSGDRELFTRFSERYLKNSPRRADILAAEPTVLLELNGDEVRKILGESSSVEKAIRAEADRRR